MGKIVFVDVDGTLVDYEGRLPASAVQAIRAARANGHRVYLDGLIGGNGSYVEDAGTVVLHQHITKEQCTAIVDWLHSRGLEFYLESNSGLYASERFEQAGQAAMQEYSRRKGRPGAEEMTVRKAFPEMIFGLQGAQLYRDDVNKISYLLSSYQDHLDTAARFPEMENHTWGGAGETALFGDIAAKAVTKATAIAALLRHLGADRADTVAIGDAQIDIPMFEACAQSVCMGSGGEAAKAAAGYVTTDVVKDGLYNAFAHLRLL